MIKGIAYFIFAAGITMITSLILIPVLRRIKMVDVPGALTIHSKPIPRGAGIAFMIALLTAIKELSWLYAGIAAVFLTGLLDDIKRLKPIVKLLLTIVSTAILWIIGIRLKAPIYLSLPFTLMIMIFLINSYNLLDGMDGLLSLLSGVIFIGFALLFYKLNFTFFLFSMVFAGISFGFLSLNFPPAHIFMGDSGSYTLGVLTAILTVGYLNLMPSKVYIVKPIILFLIPIIDTGLAILRRFKKGESIFIGDREHVYDKMLKKGMSQRKTLFIFALIQIILTTIAVVIK